MSGGSDGVRAPFQILICGGLALPFLVSCASPRATSRTETLTPPEVASQTQTQLKPEFPDLLDIQQIGFSVEGQGEASSDRPVPPPAGKESTSLAALEQLAVDQNPRLVRLYHEYQAAAARTRYADQLPDPRIGANVFGNPIETASGSQRANLNISQMVPWLEKLEAQQQRACFEALAVQAEYTAERLKVLAGVRTGWYRLYVIEKQIETTNANQKLLESLIDVANARIATGQASPGDVLLGTLELSQLEERLLMYRKQRRSAEAEINRLLGRSGNISISSPESIEVGVPKLNADAAYQLASGSQPEIEAARIRTQATRWGIEVARLSRRPELTFSASYFVTDNNRPASGIVDVGEDPWALGVQMSVPLWREKYDAIEQEASWKHHATMSGVQELADRYKSLLIDLLAEADRAAETARLYQSTILPQARQTLASDQDAYANGAVEFDRVIRDYRSLLTLELGYHTAIGDLAIAVARLQQASGSSIPQQPLFP